MVLSHLLPGCGDIPQPQAKADAGMRADYTATTGRVAMIAAGAEDAPRVIFLHGTPGDREGFVDYLIDVPAGRRYLSIDRPGFGDSAPEGAVTAFEAQASAVDPLLETIDGKAPIVVGHSLGGPLAFHIAATRPDKVAAIVVLAGSADPGLEKIHPAQYVGDTMVGRALLPRKLQNANEELLAHKAELTALGALLPGITVPVVVVHGTEDDLVPIGNVDYMRDMLPEGIAEYDVIEGQNHFLPWNNIPAVRRGVERAVTLGWGE